MIALLREEHLAEPLSAVCHSAFYFLISCPLSLEDVVIIVVVGPESVLGTLSPFAHVNGLQLTVEFGCIRQTAEAIELSLFEVAFVPQSAALHWVIVPAEAMRHTIEALAFVRHAS